MIHSLRRAAPAKVNLWLRVGERRPDGYHEIDSLFLPLRLSDEIELRVEAGARTRVECRCVGHEDLEGEENLATRAARAYLREARLEAGIEIEIRKRIWIGAGLGGGSSDAAATLLGLQELLGGLDRGQLAGLALAQGADVPFFLDPRPARVCGIGEQVEPLSGAPSLDLVLVNPGRPLPTREVYAQLDAERRSTTPLPSAGPGPVLAPGAPMTREALLRHARNDLEPPARALCPEVGRLKQLLLDQGALAAGLSGSGPTVFGVFPSDSDASRVAAQLGSSPGLRALSTATVPA